MTRGVVYSKGLATASAVAIAAAGTTFWLSAQLKSKIVERQHGAASLVASLSAQIVAKSEFEDERLEMLRDRVRRIKLQLGTDDTWDCMLRKFGDRWAVEPGQKENRKGSSVQRGVFRLRSPKVTDWPEIIEAVKDAEALPGVEIVEFEMKTSGSLARRSLDSVTAHVAVQTRRNGSNLAESK
jgi:hypothetical protein